MSVMPTYAVLCHIGTMETYNVEYGRSLLLKSYFDKIFNSDGLLCFREKDVIDRLYVDKTNKGN